ncbi:MAG: hypothetical protein HXY23_12505 [Parvularculaceae bacterium]|jgi:hypothetical protein|nr:hypothetical protein [Parvularculaceae bacterium]
MSEAALFALLHLLVFAYWLGGDIGVFYSSFVLTDERRPAAGRLAAGQILNAVDLIPRLALLMALPTGLALAGARGWLDLGPAWLAAAFVAALGWALLLRRLHHDPSSTSLRLVDLALRWAFLSALAVAGCAGLAGMVALPAFIAAKCLVLAFCVAMGLCVRATLAPFGPAFARLASGAPDADSDRTVRRCLARARVFVVLIWIALVAAAWLGVAAPI